VNKDWEFVSKGTEISLGKFVSEFFTPLTLSSQMDVVSTEDTDEIWEVAKEEAMEKVRGRANRQVRADSPVTDEAKVEKSVCLSRPDGWVINRKRKKISSSLFFLNSKGPPIKIILLEFKRTSVLG